MHQSKTDSILEAVTNIFIGFMINFTANMAIFPLLGWQISVNQNIALGVCYTIISLIRSYSLRRIFNGRSVYAVIKSKIPTFEWINNLSDEDAKLMLKEIEAYQHKQLGNL